jgi:hypothetical protein
LPVRSDVTDNGFRDNGLCTRSLLCRSVSRQGTCTSALGSDGGRDDDPHEINLCRPQRRHEFMPSAPVTNFFGEWGDKDDLVAQGDILGRDAHQTAVAGGTDVGAKSRMVKVISGSDERGDLGHERVRRGILIDQHGEPLRREFLCQGGLPAPSYSCDAPHDWTSR